MQLTAIFRSLNLSWRNEMTLKLFRIMKFTAFFLLAVCMQVAANTKAQNVTLKVKDAHMKQVFREIQKQTGLNVMIDEAILEKVGKVTLNVLEMPVSQVLNICFKNEPVAFNIIDGRIVVKPLAAKLFQPEVTDVLLPPPVDVKGRLINEKGEPVEGASILVKGSKTKGTTTNNNGYFELKGVDKDVILVISAINIETFEVEVNGKTDLGVINVKIKVTSIEDLTVQVSTGYQKIAKSRTTGSFFNVENKTIDRIQTLNIFDRLEGQVAGLAFVNGSPLLRGVATFRQNESSLLSGVTRNVNQPLIVLDNHPIEAEFFETINADDIESVTFLKDAAAASIWGARAANGVIVLKSKKTKTLTTPLTINFSSSLSFEKRPDLTKINGSTASLLELQDFQAANGWALTVGSNGDIVPTGLDTYNKFYKGNITEQQKDAIINQLRKNDFREEFSRLFLRSPVRKRYNLSLSGGGQKNTYFFSASYNDILTNTIGQRDSRLNLNGSNTFFITPKLKFNVAMNLYMKHEKLNGFNPVTVQRFEQYDRVLDDAGNQILRDRYNFDIILAGRGLTRSNFPYDWRFNLLNDRSHLNNTNKEAAYRVNAGVEYGITKYLNIAVNYQYDESRKLVTNLYSDQSFFTRNLLNAYTSLTSGRVVNNIPLGAIRDNTNIDFGTQTFNGQLNFSKVFEDHDLTFLAGAEVRKLMSEYTEDRRYGFDPQSLTTQMVNYTAAYPRSDNTFLTLRIPTREINAYEENRFVSTYFNLGYNFKKRYKLSGSYRLDDSNLFGASPLYRNIPLWSVGAAWDIRNESFFKTKFIDKLLLRATLGTGGNIDRSTSPLTILQSSVNTITGRGGPGDRFAFLRNPPNPTLRWEKTTTQNIGIDFSLFNNRFYGSAEYYKRVSEDLLLQTNFNPTYGIASALYNTASMSNKGLDLNLNVQVLKGKFNWLSTINFSMNKNTVESVNFNNSNLALYFNAAPRVGKPLNHLYSYNWAGLSSTGTSQVYNNKGDIIGANDIYTFVPEDLQYSGEIITPKIYGGFINAFSYKNFSLTAILTYKAGHKFIKNSGDLSIY